MVASAWQVLAVDPLVSNVRGKQREGSRMVEITYDVADPDSPTMEVYLKVSSDGGKTWTGEMGLVSGDVGEKVVPGTGKRIVWDAGKELPNKYGMQFRYRVGAIDFVVPPGFVEIRAGTFVMGSPESEGDRSGNETQHTVTLTRGFYLSDHEVTQSEYQAVMGNNPSQFTGDLNRPVEMSWDDAVLYCQKLTERERAAGRITVRRAYRLPTEAEWEYAARAGTTGARYGELDTIAWWGGNAGNQTRPVKQKAPNAWGLYDMIGNVWEWCSDWYGDYPTGSVTDPTGSSSGPDRVYRGGSWDFGAGLARSAARGRYVPGGRDNGLLGFRPALSSVR